MNNIAVKCNPLLGKTTDKPGKNVFPLNTLPLSPSNFLKPLFYNDLNKKTQIKLSCANTNYLSLYTCIIFSFHLSLRRCKLRYRVRLRRIRKVRTAQSNAPVNCRLSTCRDEKVPQKMTVRQWADKGENVV